MPQPMAIVSIAQRLAREMVDLQREVGNNYSIDVQQHLQYAVTQLDAAIQYLKAANIICAAEYIKENKNGS